MNSIQADSIATLKHTKNLINYLVNIKDETSGFLLTLEDGRGIHSKGWNKTGLTEY
ncbi:hypothetical protein B0H12DRAFT_1084196 [Mycena haematopus]|nr:hypothetical protein B0H12DRAFT_1084196 [Mycena haematopus]